jgi:predicted thioredoxin/glutaredoxin
MKIDIYMAEICGSYHQLRENLNSAIAELKAQAEVVYHTVSYEEALDKGIKGSPSIWINGKDAFESSNSPGIM